MINSGSFVGHAHGHRMVNRPCGTLVEEHPLKIYPFWGLDLPDLHGPISN